jgi:hypothetical protein
VSTTNYTDTFIAVAPDCDVAGGIEPPERATPSVAGMTFRMIAGEPYRFTSDDVIFGVWADRRGIPEAERAAAREVFFSKGQACLRASDLGKRYGWGVHSDAEGRVALVGVETPEYEVFASGRAPVGTPVEVTQAMRSRR